MILNKLIDLKTTSSYTFTSSNYPSDLKNVKQLEGLNKIFLK